MGTPRISRQKLKKKSLIYAKITSKVGSMKTHNNKAKNSVKKLRIAAEQYDFVYQVKYHQLTKKFPEMTAKELHDATVEIIEKASR